MSGDSISALVNALGEAVGRQNVATAPGRTEHFRKGFRSGEGPAAAVVMTISPLSASESASIPWSRRLTSCDAVVVFFCPDEDEPAFPL